MFEGVHDNVDNGVRVQLTFLGLHDLSRELRGIVDQNILGKLYKGLSKKKQVYLKSCMHQSDKLVAPELGLRQWDGNLKKLESVLHQRGIMRMATALAGQDPQLIWQLQRHLDTGRSKLLRKYYRKKEIPGVTPALTLQIRNLQTFLSKNS